MIQFYVLSVFLNIVGGYALATSVIPDSEDPLSGLRSFLRGDASRLIMGFLSIVVGLFKFLSAVEGDLPVIGDLFPALSGLFLGTALLLDYYSSKSSVSSSGLDRMKRLFLGRRRAVGLSAMAVGVLHFVFPRIILL